MKQLSLLAQSAYFNTTNESPAKAAEFEAQAEFQEDIVLQWFKEMDISAPPSLVHKELIARDMISGQTPLTSIRRAISNLTRDGCLRKTETKMRGSFGRNEFCWELVK